MDMEHWLGIDGRGVASTILAKTYHASEAADIPILGGAVPSDRQISTSERRQERKLDGYVSHGLITFRHLSC